MPASLSRSVGFLEIKRWFPNIRRGGPYCEDGNSLEPILGSPDLRKLPSPAGSAKLEDSEAYHNRVYIGFT